MRTFGLSEETEARTRELDALSPIASNADIDRLVSNINMPRMDGLRVRIRSSCVPAGPRVAGFIDH